MGEHVRGSLSERSLCGQRKTPQKHRHINFILLNKKTNPGRVTAAFYFCLLPVSRSSYHWLKIDHILMSPINYTLKKDRPDQTLLQRERTGLFIIVSKKRWCLPSKAVSLYIKWVSWKVQYHLPVLLCQTQWPWTLGRHRQTPIKWPKWFSSIGCLSSVLYVHTSNERVTSYYRLSMEANKLKVVHIEAMLPSTSFVAPLTG